ncbi:MAG: DUF4249 domain-containing protein, partial [Balneolales bacterium]|nr:DUF4249 domain-containing protein [Balneolales bacterium]
FSSQLLTLDPSTHSQRTHCSSQFFYPRCCLSPITEDFANSLLLDSARVTISYDGITDTLEPFINGLYFTELTSPENYQVLELTVFDSTTSETSTAMSVLLPGVELDSVSLTRRDTAETFLSDLDYTFPDPEGENFFVIHVYQFTPPETDSADADSGNTGLFFEDDNFLVYEQIFTDRSAEEGIIRRDAVFEFSSPVDSALVVLTHIEEGYYNFLEARSRSGSLAASLANEPVNHPTNVQNGVGYFSAHQPRGQIIIVRNEE